MGDVRTLEPSDAETAPEPPRTPGRGRLPVVLIALAVLAVIGTVAVFSAGTPGAPEPTDDASATLDAALAAGEPAYVLIHSLT